MTEFMTDIKKNILAANKQDGSGCFKTTRVTMTRIASFSPILSLLDKRSSTFN